jgi:hypothetical protein
MDGNGSSDGLSRNGHHPPGEPSSRPVNPYVDIVAGSQPREIVEFEMDTDPYANMLPGISNIRAARTIARGVRSGAGGRHPVLVAVSLLLLFVLVLPAILSIISQLIR